MHNKRKHTSNITYPTCDAKECERQPIQQYQNNIRYAWYSDAMRSSICTTLNADVSAGNKMLD